MNFADFQFWTVLFACMATFLLLRRLVARIRPSMVQVFDSLALAASGMVLFYTGAGTSFYIFVAELMVVYLVLWALPNLAPSVRPLLRLSVLTGLLLVLGYFKYADFFLNSVLHLGIAIPDHSIPPGISFYTFQLVAFVIDTVRDDEPIPAPASFVNFVGFFPQIVAGPIERRKDLLPQVRGFRLQVTAKSLNEAIPQIVLGLFYKLVLADNLASVFAEGRGNSSNPYVIWLTTAIFGLRIYFDFAGYSLIAVGLANALSIRLTQNFRAPYSAMNIQDFWRRWHITLSGWFRDYVYKPLGGGRVSWWAGNTLLVFFLSGLWHGAGFNFIYWGLAHGVLLIGYRLMRRGIPMSRPISWLTNAIVVTFTWLFFYETNFSVLSGKIRALFTVTAYAPRNLASLVGYFDTSSLALLAVLLAMCGIVLIREFQHKDDEVPYQGLLDYRISLALVVLVITGKATTNAQFLYFAF